MESRYDPPYGAAALAGLAAFALYVATLAPSTAFWDASEYIATAHIVGIPHPPGNPLFVVLGRVWTLMLEPLGLSVAVRVNLLAAATSAAATGFFFLVAHRIVRAFVPAGWMALAGAGASALIGATAFTVWHQSTANEKVYTLSVLVVAAVTWLAVLWRDRKDEPGSLRYPLIALYLLVLGSTNHLMSVLPAPALLVLVALAGPRFLLMRAFWVRALPLLALGLSFNFFLPVRAADGPVINEGQPVCESVAGAAAAIYSNGRWGCEPLASSLQREQYAKPPVGERQAPLGHQLFNFFQWFDWQWARGAAASEVPGNARLPFTLLFLALGFVGLWAAYRADGPLFGYLATLVAVLTAGLVFYLNFEYGFSLRPDVEDRLAHEVRERDYFFVASFIVWGMLAGVGLTWAWVAAARAVRAPRARLLTAPLLLVALIPLAFNWGWASRRGQWAARDWAYDLLMSVEPYAVLFTNGDNDTFPLWYVQEVEGIRKDVTVIVGQYLHTTWYPKQLQALTTPCEDGEVPARRSTVIVCQRPFDPVVEGLYPTPPPPPEAIVTLAARQMDLVGSGRLPEDVTVPFEDIALTYPQGTYLDRSHRLALAIIRDSIGERPVYFSAAGGMMSDLGLTDWGVRHGLVTRLEMRPLETPTPEAWVRASAPMGGEWFDLPHTLRLWDDVYRFRGIRERDIWMDRSVGVPWQYYALALQIADVAERAGYDPALVRRFRLEAARFALVAQGGSEVAPAGP